MNFWIIAFSLIGVMGALGCTSKSDSAKVRHETARQESAFEQGPAVSEQVEALSRKAVEDVQAKVEKGQMDIVRDVLEPNAGLVLFENKSFGPDDRLPKAALEKLSLFNWAMIELMGSNDPRLRTGKWIERYKEAVFFNCRIDKPECPNLKFFAMDFQSAVLLRLFAEQNLCQGLRGCGFMIYVAYELKAMNNRQQDVALDRLYLKNAEAFKREIEALGTGSSQMLRRHNQIVGDLLTRVEGDSEVTSMVSKMRPFEILASAKSEEEEKAVRPFVLYAVRNLKLHDVIMQIKPIVVQKEERDGQSLTQMRKAVLGLGGAKEQVFEALQIELLNVNAMKDEDVLAYYLIDQLFFGRISMEMAGDIWDHADINQDGYLKLLSNYLRAHLVSEAVFSNYRFGQWLQNPRNYKADDIFYEGRKAATRLNLEAWSTFQRRADNLKIFFKKKIETSENVSAAVKEQGKFFTTLHRDIKLTSEYPQMMMLMYYMARLDFQVQLFFGGAIETDQFLSWIFNGNAWNWFSYSTNRTSLNQIEVFKAFYFAALTDVFSDSKVQVSDFYRQILKEFMGALNKDLRVQLRDVEGTMVRTKPARVLDQVCQSLKSGAFEPQEMTLVDLAARPFYSLRYQSKSPYGSQVSQVTEILYWFAMDGSSVSSSDYYARRLDEVLETIRVDLGPKLRIASLIGQLIKEAASRSAKATSGDKDAIAKVVADAEGEYLHLSRKSYGQLFDLVRKFDDCAVNIHKTEQDRRIALLAAEREHLTQVHKALRLLNQLGSQANLSVQEARVKTAAEPFWQTPWAITLSESEGLLDQLNSMLTAGVRLQSLNLPSWAQRSVQQQGFVQKGNQYELVYGTLPLLLRLRSFLSDGYTSLQGQRVAAIGPEVSVNIYSDQREMSSDASNHLAKTKRFAYREEETEFVRSIFELFRQEFISYTHEDEFARYYVQSTRTLMTLYRAGEVTKLPSNSNNCEKDCVQDRFTAQEFVQRILRNYSLVNLSESERNLLAWTSTLSPYRSALRWKDEACQRVPSFHYRTFRDHLSQEPLGYFDYPMFLAMRKYLGYNTKYDGDETCPDSGGGRASPASMMKDRKSAFEEATQFYTAVRSNEKLMFDESLKIDQILVSPFRSLVHNELEMLSGLKQAIQDLSPSVEPGFWVETRAEKRTGLPFLSSDKVRELNDYIDGFHRDTGNYFRD